MDFNKLKEEMKTFPRHENDAVLYTVEFKEHLIAQHYENNISLSKMARNLTISQSLLSKWKAQYGNERTGYDYGKSIRYDVRTKCLAVKDMVENGKTPYRISQEFKCSSNTSTGWYSKYKDTYTQYLDLPDGVPYIVAEHKHVYGNKNIDRILALLDKQEQELDDQLSVVRTKKESIQAAISLLQAEGVKVA